MNKHIFSNSFLLQTLLALLILLSFYTCKAETLTSPKVAHIYPDIWGYDLSEFPAIKEGKGQIFGYKMPDSDVWFLITYSLEFNDPMEQFEGGIKEEKFMLLKFFKGETILLNEEQKNEIEKKITEGYIGSQDGGATFSDGSTLNFSYDAAPRLCYVPNFMTSYYTKTDLKGNKKKYSILEATSHVEISEGGDCYSVNSYFYYGKLNALNTIFDLGDDTFIVYANGSNVIIRFDKDLNTKFKPKNPLVMHDHDKFISSNFFVIDYSIIEKLKENVDKEKFPFFQTIHDKILLILKEQHDKELYEGSKQG